MTAEDTLAAGLEEYRRARIRRACLLLWGLSGCLLPLVAFASLRLGKAIPALVCLVAGVAITLVCHRIVRAMGPPALVPGPWPPRTVAPPAPPRPPQRLN